MAKASGTSGARGYAYETRTCMVYCIRGFTRGLKNFRLEYQVTEGGKFDDVIFRQSDEKYQLIQLKHKENITKDLKITHAQLFNNKYNTDFNLLKYVKTAKDASLSAKFKDKIKYAVVLTNICFDLKNNQLDLVKNARPWYKGLKTLQLIDTTVDDDVIFDFDLKVCPDVKYYKFAGDEQIVQILERQADMLKVEVGNITKEEIQDALKCIIYAVGQPNDKDLENIMKIEIKEHFKLQDTETIYNALEKRFRDWCDRKESFGQTTSSTSQHLIEFKDLEEFFQKHVKRVSFGVVAPTRSFTGRVPELEKLRENLHKTGDSIVSQSAAISGLGGIGKTELTKQFIEQYGKSDFYGRVIWIEAESDDTVKKSFKELADNLDIKSKTIKALIKKVFDYFDGMKVLFVFDNFDENPASDKLNLVVYCRELVSDPNKEYRPYFIFTSRNKTILPNVELLELGVLSVEEAIKLIKDQLMEVNETQKAEDVEEFAVKLAQTLQCFPLALQQAIAYIKQKHEKLKRFDKRYEIQDYLIDFENEKVKLLKFDIPTDFEDKNSKIKPVLVTWNITFKSIKADKKNGKNAIKVLLLLGHLYADKINARMFLSLFKNNEERSADALHLLEKYSMITFVEKDFFQIHRLVQAVIQLKYQMIDGSIEYTLLSHCGLDFLWTHFKYQKSEKENLEKAWELVDPKFYKRYFSEHDFFSEKCSIDNLLHYNNLSTYMKKHVNMNRDYEKFLRILQSGTLRDALFKDDLDRIKLLNITKDDYEHQIKQIMVELIVCKCNKLIEYLIEKSYLELNDVVGKDEHVGSIIEASIRWNNLEIFKLLVKKGADLSKVLEFAPTELISEIVKGRLDSVEEKINALSEDHQKIFEETLLFATIFRRKSIVELLKNKLVNQNSEWVVSKSFKSFSDCYWSPIFVAARFSFNEILEVLLPKTCRDVLKDVLFKLLEYRSFICKVSFEKVFNRYCESGGSVNDQDDDRNSFLLSATYQCYRNNNFVKLKIVRFLLEKGADPFTQNNRKDRVLNCILEMHPSDDSENDDKIIFTEILNQIVFAELTTEKFMKVIRVFDIGVWTNELQKFFEELVKKIGGINVRNDKGETFLINYVQDSQDKHCAVKIVDLLIKNGADVHAKDKNKKMAIFYAVSLKNDDVFMYLLNKTKSVDEEILIEAIKRNKLSIVNALIPKYFRKTDQFLTLEQTPVELAILCKAADIQSFLTS